LAASEVEGGAKLGCPCIGVGEGVCTQTQQFGVIELMAILGCDAERDVEPVTGLVVLAGGEEQPSDNGVVDGSVGFGPNAVPWIMVRARCEQTQHITVGICAGRRRWRGGTAARW
jgi:hypothetical protein